MSSTSFDSIPHGMPPNEPISHFPPNHYQPQPLPQWSGEGGLPFSFLPPGNNGANASIFKHEPYQSSVNSSGVQQYNDLPTPLAYSGGPYQIDPFVPSNVTNMAGTSMDNNIGMSGVRATINGRGTEFSSAFGLMSLDDAAVLAGMASDGVPFFGNQQGSSPDSLHNLIPSLPPQASNGSLAHGGATGFDPNNSNAQTPNTKERETRTIREMWAAFLRDPTTGLKADGTEMGKPEFPVPPSFQQNPHPPHHLHRRSSSYSGGTSNLAAKTGQPGSQYSHMAYSQQQPQILPGGVKSPHMPVAQHTLHGSKNVIKKLEDQALKIEGDNPVVGTPAPVSTGLLMSSENLRSYEEAILARKAPVLKLPAKIKTRESSGSTSSGGGGGTGSNILPSISQSARASGVGGGVASLSIQQQQPLPTASGASGVPPGTTPNTALYAAQNTMADRPVIAMPKSRSRPTTANGPGSRPNTAGGGNVNSAHSSQPPSRPGTASSQGGAGSALSPRLPHNSTQSSPHPPLNAHSLPGSRPSTSSAPSPSYSFAFAPPPYSLQNQPYATFHPGSLPSESIISPASANSACSSHQLVTALSNAGMLETSPNIHGRPTYKRLASQVLEPSSTKRPHLRRGDTNFNPTLDDQSGDFAMDGFESEGVSDAGGSERAFGFEQRGYTTGPGFGQDHGHGVGLFARRMSEPAVTAPRMMVRMQKGSN